MQDAVETWDLDRLPEKVRALLPADATRVRAEVAFALDVATGAARELGTGREYTGLGPFEIPGQADLIAIAPGRAVVIDYKGALDVGAPEANEQILFYAAAVARAYGLNEVTVAVSYLVTDRFASATLDVFEIDAFLERLRQLFVEVAEQRAAVAAGRLPTVAEGAHCRFCPAAGYSCPATTVALRRLVTGTEADELELMQPLDDETARLAYERLGAAKNLLKRVERALYARAAERPIPLGNGRFFGRHTKLGNEKLDGDTVFQVTSELYGREVADAAVTRQATKKRLGEALKAAGPAVIGGPVSKAEAAVLAEVRKRGGSRREETEAVEEFHAAPRLVEASG